MEKINLIIEEDNNLRLDTGVITDADPRYDQSGISAG